MAGAPETSVLPFDGHCWLDVLQRGEIVVRRALQGGFVGWLGLASKNLQRSELSHWKPDVQSQAGNAAPPNSPKTSILTGSLQCATGLTQFVPKILPQLDGS